MKETFDDIFSKFAGSSLSSNFIISSNDITDKYLTEKISIAKIMRVSTKIIIENPNIKFWLISDYSQNQKPIWDFINTNFKWT